MLETYFTPDQIAPIKEGIRLYIQMIGFIHSDNPLKVKWMADEQDLHSALDSVASAVIATESMIGKRKYQGVDFDVAKEVKKDLMSYLMSGRDEAESAGLAKRNQPMYYLVVVPVLNLFALPFDHAKAIEIVDAVIEEVQAMIWTGEDYGSLNDAIAAERQMHAIIKQIDEVRQTELNAKKRKRRVKRNPLIEMLVEIVEEEPELFI